MAIHYSPGAPSPRLVQNYVGFVDVGFLRARLAQVAGARREEAEINPSAVVTWLETNTQLRRWGQFLRAYAYTASEGEAEGPDEPSVLALKETPGMQVRLGHLQVAIEPAWQRAVRRAIERCGWSVERFEEEFTFRPSQRQKGVDTLFVLDLLQHAQQGVYDTAVLIAGDRDFEGAVRAAQDLGKRMFLAAPAGTEGSISSALRHVADGFISIDEKACLKMLGDST